MKKIISCAFLAIALLSSQAYAAKAECDIKYDPDSVSVKRVKGGYMVTIAPKATIHHRDKTTTKHKYPSPIELFYTDEEYKEDAIVNETVNAVSHSLDVEFMKKMEEIKKSCHAGN